MRLTDVDALINDITERYCKDCERRKGIKNGKQKVIYDIGEAPCRACPVDDMIDELENAPTVDAEPTEEQVKEYCRKRSLVIVTSELFNEMKARWSAEPVRHGKWLKNGDRYCECSVCHHEGNISGADNYCWNCGAKMDEEEK